VCTYAPTVHRPKGGQQPSPLSYPLRTHPLTHTQILPPPRTHHQWLVSLFFLLFSFLVRVFFIRCCWQDWQQQAVAQDLPTPHSSARALQ
jgi:hypothetical protein